MGKDKCVSKKKPVLHNLSCKEDRCGKKACLKVVRKGKDYCNNEHDDCSDKKSHHSSRSSSSSSSSSSSRKHHKPCKPQKPSKPCKPEKPCKLTVIKHSNDDHCKKESSDSESSDSHCDQPNSFSEKHTDSKSCSGCSCCH